ncbi:MAG: 50S ribosomal protein L24 [Candidatus Marsarchaeota archaeon]|jgi:ribosomal protein L24E|nr:50S ribosomal protein L24 [Candidatus Marsarchaeota archaeon]
MKCSYCNHEIERGTGFVFVRKTGVARYYCSKRCYRLNALQNRKYREKD